MRLWTIHPKHLDAKGLVALWREALLAQAVLLGATQGYKHHPQLQRFARCKKPAATIAAYLAAIHREAVARGYNFDSAKIVQPRSRARLNETRGQLLYEWEHLKRKLRVRDKKTFRVCRAIKTPSPHPLFRIVNGPVRAWEKIAAPRR